MKISVENICKSYGKKEILKAVSFEAESGMQVGIVGKNGIGKSTLLSVLCGVNKADGGEFRALFLRRDQGSGICGEPH